MTYCKQLTLSIFFLAVIRTAISNDISLTVQPANAVYPTENTKFEANCYGKLSSPGQTPKLSFINDDNIKLQSTPDKRIEITSTEDPAKGETNLTIVWSKIKVDDVKLGVQCRWEGGENHRFIIKVIPELSVPKIKVRPNSTLSAAKGGDYTFTCHASITAVSPVEDMDLIWTFKSPTNEKLPENAQQDKPSTGTNLTSSLTITDVNSDNGGKYYCVAVLNLEKKATAKGKYYEIVDIVEVTYAGDFENEVEEKVKHGGEAHFDCDAEGSPIPILTWKFKDNIITANSSDNYIFTDQRSSGPPTEGPPNRFLKIANVDYSDRGVYECIAQFKTEKKVKKFTLRVRDPLGALWPFIGIVVEAIVLAVIIFACETHRKKKVQEKRAAAGKRIGSPSFKETSPLVSPTGPKVSYSGGDDGVRARISTENA